MKTTDARKLNQQTQFELREYGGDAGDLLTWPYCLLPFHPCHEPRESMYWILSNMSL
jgi:hypothetical protein